MKYEQRDVVEINFVFPDGIRKPHPAIIVSNNELQKEEGFLYLCMISSKAYHPQYNFELSDEMLMYPMSKTSYVKCHLIGGYVEQNIIRRLNKIKQPYFNQIVEKIKVVLF